MSPRIPPEARWIILLPLLLGITATVLLSLFTRSAALAAGIFTIFFIAFSLYFFRDPTRAVPKGEKLIVSPADGEIIDVSRRTDEEYLEEECLRISIFMNLFNVHVNRIPVTGVIDYMRYHRGNFAAAFREKASQYNEMQSVGINTGEHRILTRQIAGILARRIRTCVHLGQQVETGGRLGLIAFGSRVDIFLPLTVKIMVERGQKIKGGESILGELP